MDYALSNHIYKDSNHSLYSIDIPQNGNQDSIYKDNFRSFHNKYIEPYDN